MRACDSGSSPRQDGYWVDMRRFAYFAQTEGWLMTASRSKLNLTLLPLPFM